MLARCVRELGMCVLSYVVMDNHYHLLVEVQDVPLDRFMMRLNRGYSWYFNRRYKRTGTIFEGRYQNHVIHDRPYYWSVVRYIVNNPVKSLTVDHPSDYVWSSHRALCTGLPTCVRVERMLSHFSDDVDQALTQYFICTEGHPSHFENVRMMQPIPVSWDDGEPDVGYATIADAALEAPDRLWDLLRAVVDASHFVSEGLMRRECLVDRLVRTGRRGRLDSLYRPLRDQFILLADADGHAHADIASFVGLSRETIRRIVKTQPG